MIIVIIVIIVINCVYCHFLIHALNCRKQSLTHLDEVETESDSETKAAEAKKSRKNRQGLPCLHNGVVSIKGLALSRAIVSKSLFDARTEILSVGEYEIRVSMGGAFPSCVQIKSLLKGTETATPEC